jgi:hypothetical protein
VPPVTESVPPVTESVPPVTETVAPVTESVTPPVKKNIVYACVFHNESYVDLLKILLTSYMFFSRSDNIDFLIFTSPDFEPMIRSFGDSIGLPLLFKTFNFDTLHKSSCARLFIFDYENIDAYEKALYIDTDVVIQGDLVTLFEQPIEDKLHALREGNIEHEIHGGWFFDFTKISKETPAINGGVMLFYTSPMIKETFQEARNHIDFVQTLPGRMPYCLDQPFVNYHFIKDGKHNIDIMPIYAKIYCCDPPPPPSEPTTVSICHFVWPLGDAAHKRKRMQEHITHLLENYNGIYNKHDTYNASKLIEKRYSWGSGYIEFLKDGVLRTKWAMGEYRMLDERTVYVGWYSYRHVIKLDKFFRNYTSFRMGDLDICSGELETTPLYIYGDSHAFLLFDKLTIENNNMFEYGKTMYSVGRDSSILKFNQTEINKFTTICLVYGEVDVRCHIGTQIALGRELKSICKELVEKYLLTVKTLIQTYKKIIILGIPPPTDPKDHTHVHADGTLLPFVGTNEERVFYTSIMNFFL